MPLGIPEDDPAYLAWPNSMQPPLTGGPSGFTPWEMQSLPSNESIIGSGFDHPSNYQVPVPQFGPQGGQGGSDTTDRLLDFWERMAPPPPPPPPAPMSITERLGYTPGGPWAGGRYFAEGGPAGINRPPQASSQIVGGAYVPGAADAGGTLPDWLSALLPSSIGEGIGGVAGSALAGPIGGLLGSRAGAILQNLLGGAVQSPAPAAATAGGSVTYPPSPDAANAAQFYLGQLPPSPSAIAEAARMAAARAEAVQAAKAEAAQMAAARAEAVQAAKAEAARMAAAQRGGTHPRSRRGWVANDWASGGGSWSGPSATVPSVVAAPISHAGGQAYAGRFGR